MPKEEIYPPKVAQRILRIFLKVDLVEEVLGDLEEKYLEKSKNDSKRAADLSYWYQTFHYLRPFAVRTNLLTRLNPFFMWRHNLKITFRKFRRNKTSFLINLIGLATGLACALLIFLWVIDEISVDGFHEADDRLYQVMLNLEVPSEILTFENTPVPLARTMLEEMPEVQHAVTVNDFFNWGGKRGLLSFDDKHIEVKGLHAEEDFFTIFSFPLLKGNKKEVLRDKQSILISDVVAKKLFSSVEQSIGKTLDWKHPGYNGAFQVEGVFEAPPPTSTMQFDVLFHFSHLIDNDQWANRWNGSYGKTYFVLQKGADIKLVNDRLDGLGQEKCEACTNSSLFAMRYSDKYLYGDFENGLSTGKGRISYVKLFSLIAIFLLLIASVNFMNLTTAEATMKMKEIGVKKTIGATRRDLMAQLLGESVLLSFLALLLAAALVVLLLPKFNTVAGKQLQLSWNGDLILGALAIMLVTGLVSGSYPAFYLSGFKPVAMLKGKLTTFFNEIWIRKGLVIFQFSISLVFIVGLLVVNHQVEYAHTKSMGYDRHNVISFPWKGELYDNWSGLGEEGKTNEKYYGFIEGLRNIPGVSSATQMTGNVLDQVIGQGAVSLDNASDVSYSVKSPIVGYDFLETLGIELLAGRSFSREHNDSYFTTVIVNEAAAKLFGMENPIGEKIRVNGSNEIIGMVRDFHYGSLYNGIEPLIFRFDINCENILVKIEEGRTKETLVRLREHYQKFLPGQSFEYSFLDDDYKSQYESEMRVATLSKYFSGLAIIISCLGLFGLAMFTAQRRKKEIGIRKVLGSSVFGIIQMLSQDFTKTVGLAILVAIPISYLVVARWLANFEYHIVLKGWLFLLPAILLVIISWLTVSMQTLQAARANPVESLKDE